ncbi:MAG TPA: uracil phosphoribosyltransferase [Mycobacteriales bacterium]
MKLVVVDHALVRVRVTELRDRGTSTARFRAVVDELATLLAVEATRSLDTAPRAVQTPLAESRGAELVAVPLLVPVLRAGFGLLPAFSRLFPDAPVGFAGLTRDESTLAAHWYLDRIPAEVGARPVLVLDPMLATGGTLLEVLRLLAGRGAASVTVIALIAAPEGVQAVENACAAGDPKLNLTLYTAAVDDRLDERGFIVPGLGDAGDRLFGTEPA